MTARQRITTKAKWAVQNHAHFNYSEGADRMGYLSHSKGTLPVTTDCSGFVRWVYWMAGCPDPMGLGYNVPEGYTGTLLSHNKEIPLSAVKPGDLIVYGPGTGEHVALVIQGGPDPLTVSHGQQGDPSLVRVSQDGRQPQRYLRCQTTVAAKVVHKATALIASIPRLNKVMRGA